MQNTVKCPKCSAEINVEAILGQQIEEKYRQQFQKDIDSLKKDYDQKNTVLTGREQALQEQADSLEKRVAEKTQAELAKQKAVLKEALTVQIRSELEVKLQSLTEENTETKKQLQQLKSAQIENERLKRQIESQKQDLEWEFEKKAATNEAELRKKFSETLKLEAEEISKRESERVNGKVQELEKQLADARKAAEDAVRKAEQRSQQLQGEIQELLIEDFLKTTFPFDQVNEVKKGQYGADVVQVVRNAVGNTAGTIMYESKNTATFGNDWIDKLKTDAVEAKADVLILVTKTMPKGIEHTERIDGVWVCPVKEFPGTARVLRESLLRISEAYSSQTNKEGKIQMLYDYLTNGKFVDQIKQVISDFNELRDGYEKEKTSMQKIWKKRDAQIDAMLKNTTSFVTQIQVIAGSAIPQLLSPEDELLALGHEE